MKIDGYDVSEANGAICVSEIAGETTKSWKTMLDFSDRFPTGFEPEWDSFVKKHTSMQNREIDSAVEKYINLREKE